MGNGNSSKSKSRRGSKESRHSSMESSTHDQKRGVCVILNVYNLQGAKPGSMGVNERIGLGVYHTGIEVFGKEWSFGGDAHAPDGMCGVFACRPKSALPMPLFAESIVLGTLPFGTREPSIGAVLETLCPKWDANTYHLMRHNCNHFTHAFRDAIVKAFPDSRWKEIPSYVNRAARVAGAIVPEALYQSLLRNSAASVPNGQEARSGNGAVSGEEKDDVVHSIPIPSSREVILAMSVREIKTMMWVNGISWEGCVEKEDLVRNVEEWQTQQRKRR